MLKNKNFSGYFLRAVISAAGVFICVTVPFYVLNSVIIAVLAVFLLSVIFRRFWGWDVIDYFWNSIITVLISIGFIVSNNGGFSVLFFPFIIQQLVFACLFVLVPWFFGFWIGGVWLHKIKSTEYS